MPVKLQRLPQVAPGSAAVTAPAPSVPAAPTDVLRTPPPPTPHHPGNGTREAELPDWFHGSSEAGSCGAVGGGSGPEY